MQIIPSLFPAGFQPGVTHTKLLLEGTVTSWNGAWPISLAFYNQVTSIGAGVDIATATFSVEMVFSGDVAPVGTIFYLGFYTSADFSFPATIVYSKLEFKP